MLSTLFKWLANYWVLGLLIFLVFGIKFLNYFSLYISARKRDRGLNAIAQKYAFQLDLDYKNFSYNFQMPVEKTVIPLRRLTGVIKNKNIEIQDRFMTVKVANIIMNWQGLMPLSDWWTLKYCPPNAFAFGYGVGTYFSVDGQEKDITKKNGWISLAPVSEIETLLESI